MARIVISVSGTWGELLPMLALGKELVRRGHAVQIAVTASQHELVREAGFEVISCGPVLGPEEARRLPALYMGRHSNLPEAAKFAACLADTPRQFRDLANACEGADMLIAHASQLAAAMVFERLHIPWVCVSTSPSQFDHFEYQACSQPAPLASLNLLASSMLYSLPDLGLSDHVSVTGFLSFDGSGLSAWKPSPEIRAFVEEGDRVLVHYAGCLPGPDASARMLAIARAAIQLKRKLVIQTGWAEVSTQDLKGHLESGYICLAGPLDHDWLFAHADGVVHYGGASICARALRCGTPSLVLPQRADQFFHARSLLELGAGAAMSVAQISADGVSRVLAERVLSSECRENARVLSLEIQQERGDQLASQLIERQF